MNKIVYWIINSLLVGMISFCSAVLALNEFTPRALLVGVVGSVLAGVATFKKFWDSQEPNDLCAKQIGILI